MTDAVPLKEHLESRLASLNRLYAAQIGAIREATRIALTTLDARLAGMNEFRDTLKDQAAHLATREQVDLLIDAAERRIAALELSRAELEGRAKLTGAIWAIGASIAAGAVMRFVL